MREHVGGNVVGFLHGERVRRAAVWHIVTHERGYRVQAMHPRATVERTIAPERRKRTRAPRAVGCVTGLAALGVHVLAIGDVRRARGLRNFVRLVREPNADLRAAREERDVGGKRDHLAAIVGRRPPVHAVEKTLREPILQRDEAMCAFVPLRKLRVDAEQRTRVRFAPGIDVAGLARHTGADILPHERGRARDDIVTVCDQPPFVARRKRGRRIVHGG